MVFKIAVDCLVFAYDNSANQLKLLLVKRNKEPAKGTWALPGGFVKETEEFIDTALRILNRETGAKNIFLEQLKGYSLTDSSPDNRIASIAFYALLKLEDFSPTHNNSPTSNNSHTYQWAHINDVLPLPFDHTRKMQDAIRKIKESVHVRPVAFSLLPSRFTLNQLQKIYEEILAVKLDNRNFRRKIKGLKYIRPLHELETNVSRRPGMLHSFDEKEYIVAADKLTVI